MLNNAAGKRLSRFGRTTRNESIRNAAVVVETVIISAHVAMRQPLMAGDREPKTLSQTLDSNSDLDLGSGSESSSSPSSGLNVGYTANSILVEN